MSEDHLTALLARTGAKGKPNTADTSSVPFANTDEVVITLPMPPSVNNLFFTLNAGKGRAKSVEYRDWIREAGTLLAIQRPPQVKGKVRLLIEVAEPETRRRQDVANREKAATDLLVSHGVIEGDDQRFVREITLRWAPIEGVRITIWSLG
jgi:Holliday junction resolvase RusA-like endonuclease